MAEHQPDARTIRTARIGFGTATSLFVLVSALLWIRFTEKPMVAFPQILLLFALIPPLFYFLTTMPRKSAKQVGGICSCVIWVAGILLAIATPPSSRFIYVPDSLLMLGFLPLLYLWRYSWPWLVFGVLNFGIGILLMVIEYSPDTMFPVDLLKPKHHLAEYHPAVVWTTTGFFATAFGTGRLIKNLAAMLKLHLAQTGSSADGTDNSKAPARQSSPENPSDGTA